MPISIQCQGCARTLKVKDEFAGRAVKCPACQTPLKVPAAGDDFASLELPIGAEASFPSAPRQTPSAASSKWVDYLKAYWCLPVPLVALVVNLISANIGVLLGLLTGLAGLALGAWGFLAAVAVDPIYALSPLARMRRSDAERQRIWKKQAPHFGRFGKGLLTVAVGVITIILSFQMQSWHTGNRLKRTLELNRDLPAGMSGMPREFGQGGAQSPSPANQPNVAQPTSAPNAGQTPPVAPPGPYGVMPVTPQSVAPSGGTADAMKKAAEASGVDAEFGAEQAELPVAINGRQVLVKPLKMFRNMTVLVKLEDQTQVVIWAYELQVNIKVEAGKAVAVPAGSQPQFSTPAAATPPSNPSGPYVLTPEDHQLNIKASQDVLGWLAESRNVGDAMDVEVVGFQQGTCVGGADGIYAAMSSIETAAVHAGLLRVGEKGRLKVTVVKPLSSYGAIQQNGIQSTEWPVTHPAIILAKVH